MPKAYANRLCFLSERPFGPFHRLRDLCHRRSRFRVGFEFAQILLGPRSADRGFPFRHMLLFLAGWSTRLNYLYYIRFAPVPIRAEEKSARARTRKVMESALSALEPRWVILCGVRLSTDTERLLRKRGFAAVQLGERHGLQDDAPRGGLPRFNFAKALRSEKPAQRLHSRPET
jgi:hypothetical protein